MGAGSVIVNQPGVYFVDADGNVITAADGSTITNQEALLVAGKDGSVMRFVRVAADGTVRTDPTGTTTQPVSSASASQVDGHSASIGATSDADTANTLIGRVKQLVTLIAARLPSALISGRLDVNIGSWLGALTPTVGQKAMSASIPVAMASDQSGIPVTQANSVEKTYTVISSNTALALNKSLLSIYNPPASGVAIKFREYYLRNPQISAVTGVGGDFSLFRFVTGTTPTGGTAITPSKHDTTDAATAALCRTGATVAGEEAQPLDRMIQSTDDWGPGTLDQEGAQQNIANYLPARAKRDAQVKAFTLNPGEGIHVKFATNSTAGSMDIIIVFTQV